MTREEQIAIASCAYGSRGSSIDFSVGAKWADSNPKSPWISVEDDLPCKHDNLLVKCLPYNSTLTKPVLALNDDGSIQVCEMYMNEMGEWKWSYFGNVLYWFPIPEPPKE